MAPRKGSTRRQLSFDHLESRDLPSTSSSIHSAIGHVQALANFERGYLSLNIAALTYQTTVFTKAIRAARYLAKTPMQTAAQNSQPGAQVQSLYIEGYDSSPSIRYFPVDAVATQLSNKLASYLVNRPKSLLPDEGVRLANLVVSYHKAVGRFMEIAKRASNSSGQLVPYATQNLLLLTPYEQGKLQQLNSQMVHGLSEAQKQERDLILEQQQKRVHILEKAITDATAETAPHVRQGARIEAKLEQLLIAIINDQMAHIVQNTSRATGQPIASVRDRLTAAFQHSLGPIPSSVSHQGSVTPSPPPPIAPTPTPAPSGPTDPVTSTPEGGPGISHGLLPTFYAIVTQQDRGLTHVYYFPNPAGGLYPGYHTYQEALSKANEQRAYFLSLGANAQAVVFSSQWPADDTGTNYDDFANWSVRLPGGS